MATDAVRPAPPPGNTVVIDRGALDDLLAGICDGGYQLVGPTVHDGAIVYRDVHSAADLPIGWGDEQDGGRYRLRRREDEAVFGSCTLHGCNCGELDAGRTARASSSSKNRLRYLATPSSACVHVSCMP